MNIEEIDFENIRWPVNIYGWTDEEIYILMRAISDLGISDSPILNGNYVYIRKHRKWSFKCLIFGHIWDRTLSKQMASRSMNTCMRCGFYEAGPE